MKIGVALSGCDIGGVGAYSVLQRLEEQGFTIGMLSACGLSSATALLYAYGYEESEALELAGTYLCNTRQADLDIAIAELAAEMPLRRRNSRIPTIVSAVNVPDGRICAFTGGDQTATGRLCTFPLQDMYDVLSATTSPVEGLASYSYQGCQLCDFSVWYGCPVYPLKMAGLERIVSISFLPESPATPYEVLVKQKITASAHLADIHIPVVSRSAGQSLSQYIDTATAKVDSYVPQLCMKVLF